MTPLDLVAIRARIEHNKRTPRPLAAKALAPAKPLVVSTAARLPAWPDAVRSVPNGMLRSSLFGAIKKGPRRYMEGEEIAAQDGVKIRYTGPRLDQGDLDLWECILHICRFQDMGSQCRFTAYTMLKSLSLTDTGKNRATLHVRLMRLKSNGIEVDQGRYSYAGSLLDEVYRDKATHEYIVALNPRLRPLFSVDQFTQIDWNVRHALAGQPLAQWLHGYYSSHAKPFPIKIETIHKICGSEAKEAFHFKQDLQKALDALTAVSNAYGQPFSHEIRHGLVHVERKASATQRRHLTKKTVPKRPRDVA